MITTRLDEDAEPLGETASVMRRYLVGLVLGGVLMLMLVIACFGFLAQRGTLAPPQFSNNLCLDEKLAFMREHPPHDPNLLVVGSSVAWRHFNSPEAVRLNPSIRPYNAGLCGASIGQTRQVIGWLLQRLPTIERAVLIASPLDFANCSTNAPSTFSVRDADDYVFGRAAPYRFYLSYFDPGTLLFNSIGIRSKRHDPSSFDSLVNDGFGDGPLEPRQARELLYGTVTFDPACFAAIRALALAATARHVELTVALTPLNPEWSARYDPTGSSRQMLTGRVQRALEGTNASFLKDPEYPRDAFFDAIHLRWSRTMGYTRYLLKAAKRQQAWTDQKTRYVALRGTRSPA